MKQQRRWTRRAVLGAAGVGVAGALAGSGLGAEEPYKAKNNIKQSVCYWCYQGKFTLEKLAPEVKRLGYRSIELLGPEQILTVKRFGLTCAMMGGADIANGLNRKENHAPIVKKLRRNIDFAADNGVPNVICMSGNRRGMGDEEGQANCAAGLKQVVGYAEQKKVTLCMEGLNSRVDHKDYMYDHTRWGVDLCRKVGSPRFKLLYDIYHMQIMEGDIIRTIRAYKDYIAHFHTGGNPGRHEIDDGQELNYRAVVKAIVDTGFQGFIAQEFLPVRDPLGSLAEAFRICDV